MTLRYVLPMLATLAGTAFAAPRSLQQAQAIATDKLSQHGLVAEVTLQEVPNRANSRPDVAAQQDFTPYYIFSDSQQQAFVIVSGSDLMPEVIGYGNINEEADRELPANLQSWLESVAEAEEWLEQNPAAAQLQLLALASPRTTQVISPIMSCTWNQDGPYNESCPSKNGSKCAVGCMATAISQVLYTNQYPAQSTGQVTYSNYGSSRTVNLEGVTYNYSKMFDKVSSNLTSEQKAEVAKLCANVGAASWMQYDEESGTVSEVAAQGMRKYFGCTETQLLNRFHYSLDEWNDLLIEELQAGRPVVYTGQSNNGGHAFVVDGVNESGLYHVNWGWGGYYDGHYDISILRTEGAGIGASVNNGFYSMQQMMVNLCDPSKAGRWHSPINSYNLTENYDVIECSPSTNITKGTKLTLSTRARNFSTQKVSGNTGITVMKDGEVFYHQISSKTFSIDGTQYSLDRQGNFTYYSSYGKISAEYTIPSDIADGDYQIYLCVSPTGSDQYDMVRQTHKAPSYWKMTVSGSKVTLQHKSYGIPVSVSQWNSSIVPLTTAPNEVSCVVTNDSQESLATCYYLVMTSPSGSRGSYINQGNEYDEAVTIAPGESKTVTFSVFPNLDGQWKMQLYGTPRGIEASNKTLLDESYFDVVADETRGAALELQAAPILVNDEVYNNEQLTMELNVANTGLVYNGKMSIRIFKTSNSTTDANLMAEVTNESVQIAAGANKTVTISGILNIPNLTKNVKYYARAYFLYGSEMQEMDAKMGVTNRTAVPIRMARESGINEVTVDNTADDLSTATIFDLLGKRVSLPTSGQLRPGIYIINGKKRVIR